MSHQSVHHRIKKLIDETNDAFEHCHGINTDYAGFASMALSEFKEALENPYLTERELRQLIRKGQKQHNGDRDGNWSSFMARYVTQNSNQNVEKIGRYGLEEVYKDES